MILQCEESIPLEHPRSNRHRFCLRHDRLRKSLSPTDEHDLAPVKLPSLLVVPRRPWILLLTSRNVLSQKKDKLHTNNPCAAPQPYTTTEQVQCASTYLDAELFVSICPQHPLYFPLLGLNYSSLTDALHLLLKPILALVSISHPNPRALVLRTTYLLKQ